MRSRLWTRFGVGAALAALGWTGLVVRAQSAPAEPWSRVPAPPTGCYYDGADVERFANAYAAITADYTRQKALNDELTLQFDRMDMGVKMQRMQAFMMKDPQKAMAMMQAMQATAGKVTTQVQTSSTEGPKLDQALEAIHAKFKAEVNPLLKPINDKADAFAKAHTKPGEAGNYFPNNADEAQWKQMLAERNPAYEGMCAGWWGASGQVQAWLGNYQAFLVNEAKSYEFNDGAIVLQMQIMDSPSGGYRSVYPLEAAYKYTEKVRSIMAMRPDKESISTGWLR